MILAETTPDFLLEQERSLAGQSTDRDAGRLKSPGAHRLSESGIVPNQETSSAMVEVCPCLAAPEGLHRAARSHEAAKQGLPVTAVNNSSFVSTLDWLERIVILALYAWFVFRIVSSALRDGGMVNLLFLPSEGLVVFFMLIRRRATTISRHTGEWLAALVATCNSLLVSPVSGRALIPLQVAAAILLAGMLIQLLAKLTLGRSIGSVPAHRGLKLSGPYRFLRHPMYAGYLLSHLAFLLVNPSWWNAAVYALVWALQLYRLRAEERLLSRDPIYEHYRGVVPYRLVPGLF
jgi:protein-S-isoprenylcysteine O-methyltransferase Ste14